MKPLIAFATIIILASPVFAMTFTATNTPYQALETSHFIVRYEPGDRQAAQDVAKALEGSYEKITRDLGVKPNGKTIIELYTTPELYQRYRKPAAWAIGGKIYPGRNMIALPSPSTWGKANIHRYEDLWHVLPHEYTHLLLRGTGKGNLPMWLDEGIAVYEAGQWNTGYQRLLVEALENNKLLTLRELEDFNAFIKGGALSYAESYSTIMFMKETYGDRAFKDLIKSMATEKSFKKALKTALGEDLDKFEEKWETYLRKTKGPRKQTKQWLKTKEETGLTMTMTKDEIPVHETTNKAEYSRKEKLPVDELFACSLTALLSGMLLVRTLKVLVTKTGPLQQTHKKINKTRQ
jgi:hypothetical protein